MKRAIYTSCLCVFSAGAVLAQAPPTPAFEVASIKPAATGDGFRISGDGGHKVQVRTGFGGDQGRINYVNVSLKDMIARAYSLKPYQISGPAWIESERYDVTAKIPEGVAQDKVPEMLQGLLVERFHLTTHRETKDHAIYALIVGKNGPKLKKADESDNPMAFTAPDGTKMSVPKLGGDGAGGAPKGMMMMDSTGKMQARNMTIPNFADMLTRMLDRPVVDMTKIEGRYDITLEMAMEDLIGMKRMAGAVVAGRPAGAEGPAPDSEPRASLFTSVQQLGLKLDSRKAPVDFLVVDQAEKATEN